MVRMVLRRGEEAEGSNHSMLRSRGQHFEQRMCHLFASEKHGMNLGVHLQALQWAWLAGYEMGGSSIAVYYITTRFQCSSP
jgi:hypothetical protein